MNTSHMARGKWKGILASLGVDGSYLTGRHGPCPICQGGKDRFRWDNKDGSGSYFCNQCGSGDGFGLLMAVKGWDFKTAAAEVDKIVGNVEQQPVRKKKDPRIALKRIGSELKHTTGKDPVSMYLRGRGITGITSYGLRLHPALHYWNQGECLGLFPAMVANIQNVDGKTESFHITYLTKDGQKADVPAAKKVMSPVNTINGAAIRLAPVAEHIGITEGIENALAVMEGEGLPCWACVTAGGIESFEPPHQVKRVTIFADNDKTYTGQKAAYVLANRLVVKYGISAEVSICGSVGDDYLDSLVKSRRAAA